MCHTNVTLLALMILLPCSVLSSSFESLQIYPQSAIPSPCPTQQCLTLQQFAIMDNYSDALEILLHPGNHSLTSELIVADLRELTVQCQATPNVGDCWITCDDNGKLDFVNISTLILHNLVIFGCKNNTANSLENATFETCIFISQTGVRTLLKFTETNATLKNCSFNTLSNNDNTTDEPMVMSYDSSISIEESMFMTQQGRALLTEQGSNVNIISTTFYNSTVISLGDHPALIKFLDSTVLMKNSTVKNNNGSLILSARNCMRIQITDSDFSGNSAWECTFCASKANVSLQNSTILENSGTFSVMYLVRTRASISDGVMFSKNKGSFVVRNSIMTLNGINTFEECHNNKNHLQMGGTLTVIQSTIKFCGTTIFLENHSEKSGGAVYISESTIHIHGNLTVANNTAVNGGGAFFSLTHMSCHGHCIFSGNKANSTGGGIHAVSTTIILRGDSMWRNSNTNGSLTITDNIASTGGGISLEVNSKLYGVESGTFQFAIKFARNSACGKGGAMYVNDETYPGVCASKSFADYSTQTECFFQMLHDDEDIELVQRTQHIEFADNFAPKGSALYGGLLDRCTVSPSASIYNKTFHSNKQVNPVHPLTYFLTEGGMGLMLNETDEVASDLLRICFCQEDVVNCSYELPPISAKKGEKFTIPVVAVDQVNHTISATVRSVARDGALGEGQQLQNTLEECSYLTFSISSRFKSAELVLYVDNSTCKNLGLSKTSIMIKFKECTCPIGFQQTKVDIKCECECDQRLSPYTQKCDPNSQSFVKKDNSWIGYINGSNHAQPGYIIIPNCPYDFCLPPKNVRINLNEPDGADAQCAYNRSGLLCGQCRDGFQLSLGTPHCVQRSNSQTRLFAISFVVGAICGILMVIISLLLNITVAQGTFNGLIFYANIVLMTRSTFLPFLRPNFLTIFLNVLNTQLGLEGCTHKGIDEYYKIWQQFKFPLYMLFLVVIVIILSKYSSKCAQLIRKGNPVATLATLILLSYAQLLRTVIDIFSFTVLNYPDGSHVMVWRPDASVKYLKGKHIPLFLTAVIIVIVGLAYTVLLFSWQWLLRAPNKKIFKWIRNSKLNSFMEAYHAPYRPKYRYWTGLLLFIRVVLNVAVTANTSGNPRYNLLAIIFLTTFLLLLKAHLGDKIYKKSLLDYFESICYLNLLLFSLASFTSLGNQQSQKISAYVSISVTFVLTVCVLSYHIHYTLYGIRCYKRLCDTIEQRIQRTRESNTDCEHCSERDLRVHYEPTMTEISISDSLQCSMEELTCQEGKNRTSTTKRKSHIHFGAQSTTKIDSNSLREPLLEDQ